MVSIKRISGIILVILGLFVLFPMNANIIGHLIGTKEDWNIVSIAGILLIAYGIFTYIRGGKDVGEMNEKQALQLESEIIELAKTNKITDYEAIQSISNKLKILSIRGAKYFTQIIDDVDPNNFASQTRILGIREKHRIRQGIQNYSEKYAK